VKSASVVIDFDFDSGNAGKEGRDEELFGKGWNELSDSRKLIIGDDNGKTATNL